MRTKNKKCDPKYINIPNINFSWEIDDKETEKKFKKQRLKRGFDDTELWNLDVTIAKFIYPRLERYIKISNDITNKTKNEIEQEKCLLKAMKLIAQDDVLIIKKEEEIIKKGLQAFPKIFLKLWS